MLLEDRVTDRFLRLNLPRRVELDLKDLAVGGAIDTIQAGAPILLLHIGVVTGPYLRDPLLSVEYDHLRPVEWRAQFETRHFSVEARNQLRQPRSLFRIVKTADEYRKSVLG